jgi:hypothetical protein
LALNEFIPEIWSAKTLVALEKQHVFASLCNRDYDGEIAHMGDTVRITGIGDITVSDYTKDTDIAAPQALTDAATTLTIEKAKYFNLALDDVDQRQAAAKDIFDTASERAAYQIADSIDTYVAGFYINVTAANLIGSSGSPVTPVVPTSANVGGGTTVYDYLVQLNQLLTQSLLPKSGRWLVVPPWVTTLLMTDIRFTSFNTEAARQTLLTGQLDASGGKLSDTFIGRINGVDVYESNNAPHLSGTLGITGSTDVVFGGHVMGMTYADNLVTVEKYRPPYRFANALKGLHLFGAKIVRPYAMVAAYLTHP